MHPQCTMAHMDIRAYRRNNYFNFEPIQQHSKEEILGVHSEEVKLWEASRHVPFTHLL